MFTIVVYTVIKICISIYLTMLYLFVPVFENSRNNEILLIMSVTYGEIIALREKIIKIIIN